jgi:peptidoglycan/LPS O-acetylase OafA/YrhL
LASSFIGTTGKLGDQLLYLVMLPSLIVLLVHLVSAAGSLVQGLLGYPILRWLGQRSYGLYLYHSALYYYFDNPITHLPRRENIVYCLVASLIIAEFSYRYIESPMLKYGRKWIKARKVQGRSATRREVALANTQAP